MFKRGLLLTLLFFIGQFNFSVSHVQAQCSPDPGTGSMSDDVIICDGDDPDGINVGSGNDSITILNGIVQNTILSEGGVLMITVTDTGAIDGISVGVLMLGDGNIFVVGDVTAALIGIVVFGNGNISVTGDVTSDGEGIIILGNGNVVSTGDIYSHSGTGIVVGGDGDVTSTGDIDAIDGIRIFGDGNISSTGNIFACNTALLLEGIGDITSTGNLTACDIAILKLDTGNIYSSGNIDSGAYGISHLSEGTIYSEGDITADIGISLMGGGEIQSFGNITASSGGILLMGEGRIHSVGDVSALVGIMLLGEGDIQSVGNITGTLAGLLLFGNGNIQSAGDVTSDMIGIAVLGDGNIESVGNVSGTVTGIILGEDGRISATGSVSSDNIGIAGGPGAQLVEVNGTIDAPIAVRLDENNDVLYIYQGSNILGLIEMGAGDDVVIIGNYAVVTEIISGGELDEVEGDRLYIGDGIVCEDDATGILNMNALSTLDPENGTVTYLGQTYTWQEFEFIGSASVIASCERVGRINDGRINAYDLGAPAALYCTVEFGVSVWDIDFEAHGQFTFAVNYEQLEAAFAQAVASQTNQLIASDAQGNALYALSDGQSITFVGPDLREPEKQYTFMFPRDRCGQPS